MSRIYGIEIIYEPINLWRLVYGSDAIEAGDGTTEKRHDEQVRLFERTYNEELAESRKLVMQSSKI